MNGAADRVLVLFSGGQDSATVLAWALDRFAAVETVGFAYGQRHAVELDVRARFREQLAARFPAWAARLGADHLLDLGVLKAIGGSALTEERSIEMQANGLPSSFVPGRNLLFLTAAAALAYRRGLGTIAAGMCETDYSGYPDCRDETIRTLARAIDLGMDSDFTVSTPLMRVDKAGTWAMAHALGGDALVDLIIEDTHTCYLGDRTHRHEWGYGCGTCPACELRAKGYAGWRAGATHGEVTS
jgi:7-cyano-7-deazaguanine synthase